MLDENKVLSSFSVNDIQKAKDFTGRRSGWKFPLDRRAPWFRARPRL